MLLIVVALALFLRVYRLVELPPWLWYDEAGNGLDGRDLLNGQFSAFFSRSLGKEPLFMYLLTPFVAAMDGQPLAVRLPAAVVSVLTSLALFAAGRALWIEDRALGAWAGLTAAALWAVNYWPVSISRISFRANTLPLLLTAAVAAWLSWTRRPTRGRAAAFGLLAGLALQTYLAASATLALWPLLYATLARDRRIALRSTLVWAIGVAALALGPMLLHLALHSADSYTRLQTLLPDTSQAWSNPFSNLVRQARDVFGVFAGLAGDPNPRHNLPGRPPFSFPLAVLSLGGALLALAGTLRGSERSRTLMLWLVVLSAPTLIVAGAIPHFLRQFGALPAVLLLAGSAVAWLAQRPGRLPYGRSAQAVIAALLIALIGIEGARTFHDYFRRWANTDLYDAYQGDLWTLGERLQIASDALTVVPLNPHFGADYYEYGLSYARPGSAIVQLVVDETSIEQELQAAAGSGSYSALLTPIWRAGPHVDADPKEIVRFYAAREAEQERVEFFRGFDLASFTFGPTPEFTAPGRLQPVDAIFASALRLQAARWGAAYPAADRSAASAPAGGAFWAILSWGLEQPLDADVRASLLLVDGAGHVLQQVDAPLVDGRHLPISYWQPGITALSYHLVRIPPTQLPGPVTLEARAYDAHSLEPLLLRHPNSRNAVAVTGADVSGNAGGVTEPVAVPLNWKAPNGLRLLGRDAWPETLEVGRPISFRLFWQLDRGLTEREVLALQLGSDETALAETVLPPETPAGRMAHTYVDLAVPAGLPAGDYPVLLSGRNLGESVLLGVLSVTSREHLYDPPAIGQQASAEFGGQIRLAGLAAVPPVTMARGEAVTGALVWEALTTADADLVRFVHVLDQDGRLVGQEDTTPCRGACPASSWLPGEYLVDKFSAALPPDAPPGPYRLAVGWYSRDTFQRLAARNHDGAALADSLLILPLEPGRR
jgi:hypothetical protein